MRLIATTFCAVALSTGASAKTITIKPIIDARLRYETVDQAGPAPVSSANDADSVTLRIRSGATLSKGPFSFLAEAEATLAIDESYNSGINGKDGLLLPGHSAAFPIVADPQNIELNRIQLQYKTKPITVTVGRQRINLDDQRFVGSVGWRQNEQTFDAVRVEWTGVKNLKADVTYSWGARTIWGIDGGKFGATNRPQVMGGDDIFATLAYTTKFGTLTAFSYLIDEDKPVAALLRNASQTYGARFAGAYAVSKKVKLSYAASYAHQSDYKSNPVDYSADYYAAELGLEARGFKLTGGYELLGADATAPGAPAPGSFAFQTPFATLHKFNGWADKFLTTPANGLEDKYVSLGYTLPKVGKMGPLATVVAYHQFGSDVGDRHFGYEWDAQISLKTSKRTTLLAKYASYQRYGASDFAGDADTKKFILQLEYAL